MSLQCKKINDEEKNAGGASEQNLLSHSAQQRIGLQPQAIAAVAETKAESDGLKPSSQPAPGIFESLLQPENVAEYIPSQFKKGKKKREEITITIIKHIGISILFKTKNRNETIKSIIFKA